MIKINELKELIRTVLYTGYIEGEKPLSVLFVADVGSGKSEALNSFRLNDNIAFFTDLTYMGLIKLLEKEENLKHIIIPDFLKITMKKKSTTDNVISCFNAMMEEGLDKISIMGQEYNFKGRQLGLITATTKHSFFLNEHKWKSMGFLSRSLILSFGYTTKTKEEIFDYIYNRNYLNKKYEKESMPMRKAKVKLSPHLAKLLRDDKTDFRKQKQLQTLAMARCLMDNRNKLEVTKKDIEQVKQFKKYLNLNFTEL